MHHGLVSHHFRKEMSEFHCHRSSAIPCSLVRNLVSHDSLCVSYRIGEGLMDGLGQHSLAERRAAGGHQANANCEAWHWQLLAAMHHSNSSNDHSILAEMVGTEIVKASLYSCVCTTCWTYYLTCSSLGSTGFAHLRVQPSPELHHVDSLTTDTKVVRWPKFHQRPNRFVSPVP